MARGQARIRLDGLDAARKRIKGLNARATDKSISTNLQRIGGGYNVKQCPIDTSPLAAELQGWRFGGGTCG